MAKLPPPAEPEWIDWMEEESAFAPEDTWEYDPMEYPDTAW